MRETLIEFFKTLREDCETNNVEFDFKIHLIGLEKSLTFKMSKDLKVTILGDGIIIKEFDKDGKVEYRTAISYSDISYVSDGLL